MHQRIIIFILGILSLASIEAQYISEVVEYSPAPGQFTNSSPWGTPYAASTIVGGITGSMGLGAFGGYVIFRFEGPVENHPDNPFGVDFTIFGNPMPEWSEPGVAWVMRDDNGNDLPDDTWYELAGSDYYFSSSIRNYQVTYSNPGDTVARDVPWSDHLGNTGIIKANTIHTQPYYPLSDSFPAVPAERYTLWGTLIQGAIDIEHPPVLKSIKRAFGYADNQMRGQAPFTLPDNPYTTQVENSGGDAFDIGWAVDSLGNNVDLEQIHFVKVQNAMQADGGYLGELSTEITGAVDVVADPSVSGSMDMVVIRDLPLEISTTEYQMEVFVFHQGLLQPSVPVQWSSSDQSASIDENHLLRVSKSGPITLTASLVGSPQIKTSVSTMIQLAGTTSQKSFSEGPGMALYPNPALDFVYVSGFEMGTFTLYDSSGKMLMMIESCRENESIDISGLGRGVYIVRVDVSGVEHILKLLKR